MTEFIKSMRYLINNSTDPYFNLAFDEYCLENIHSEEPYFFLWRNRPAVIIGLNQNAYGEVNLEYLNANGITLARRVTGGGAVYHDLQNMNYTIIGRNPSPQPMVDALRQLGVPAELTGRNDIFVEGRKVSGYARRVAGNQEIIHGTLMYDVDLDTLQHVLDTPASKMKAKGISSVRSHVANLKEYLPQFKSLDELQAKLSEILSGGDGPRLAPGSEPRCNRCRSQENCRREVRHLGIHLRPLSRSGFQLQEKTALRDSGSKPENR